MIDKALHYYTTDNVTEYFRFLNSTIDLLLLTFTYNEYLDSKIVRIPLTTSSSSNTTGTNVWYRSARFWLLFLFISYSLFGWFGVPAIVQSQLSSVLKESAHWEVKIEEIVFNPYAFSLELSLADVKNDQGTSVIGFERFYINVNALSSLTGIISFDEISLESPRVNLVIDEQGQTNFQRDFAPDTNDTTTEIEETSELPTLYFGLIAISEGQIQVTDMSLGETLKQSFKPLSLRLQNFSTRDNEGGDYSLAISLGEGQQIDWQGQIGVVPFHSKGRLSLKNIQSKVFWHYVKANSPYWLNKARISVSGDYAVQMATQENDSKIQLLVNQAQLSIEELELAPSEQEANFLQLNALNVGPIEFDLEKQSLSLGTISLDSPKISALRHPDGSINALSPLQTEGSETETDAEPAAIKETQSTPFKWRIDDILVSKGEIRWQDLSLKTPADLKVKDFELKLGQLSQDLSHNSPYQLSLSTDATSHSLSGIISPQPFAINGQLTIKDFPLNWAQSYISESANVVLNRGTVSIDSQYQLAMTESLSGNITTTLQLNQLALSDSILKKPLSGFEQLNISPIVLSLDDLTGVSIDTIRLVKPYGDVFIAKDGQINLVQLSTAKPAQENEDISTAPTQSPDSKPTNETETNILIKKFEIEAGRFEFSDNSQSPHFNTYFDQITGSVMNLSSNLDAQSTVDIQGNLETYGKLSIQGTLNPLSQKPNTDLNIQVSNINLSTASPYSSRFAGYLIDKGKLDLNLNYKINDGMLEAKNHIFIDQFEFGDSVDSPDATSLPLPLAVGIMKNMKGEIDIDLPISGDLNDPSFSIGGVVFTAFTNLITKIITSPFSILGSLVEGGDDISSVHFLAGQASLDIEQTNNVIKLAEALKDRPNLTLEIRGVADSGLDKVEGKTLSDPALKRLARDRALAITQTAIDQGGINKERIFVLEPEVISSEEKQETGIHFVASKFTLDVK
jgi:uncharacterized protein involved in outer membrane biogenesis